MIFNPKLMLFSIILVVGMLLAISSPSWFGAWMGLEINLLSFIPLISKYNNQRAAEAAMKYFLVQVLASSLLMLAILLLQQLVDYYISLNMLSLSLLMKSGAAPFHFWVPETMSGITWWECFLLMTLQKFAPLSLIPLTLTFPIILFSTLMSTLIGSIGGINQTSLQKIMAFSSINHTGWMIAALTSGSNMWLIYFVIYTLMTSLIISIFITNKLQQLSHIFLKKIPPFNKMILLINLLSMAGLPPFLGFFPKWMVILKLSEMNQFILVTTMTMTALITLYFYIRISYSALTLSALTTKWHFSFLINPSSNMLIMTTNMSLLMSLLGLPFIPFITNMMT